MPYIHTHMHAYIHRFKPAVTEYAIHIYIHACIHRFKPAVTEYAIHTYIHAYIHRFKPAVTECALPSFRKNHLEQPSEHSIHRSNAWFPSPPACMHT